MLKVVRTAPSSGGRSPATGLSVESCGPPVARAALALRNAGAFCFKYNILQQESAGDFMNGFNKYLATTFLSATVLFTGAAQAMEIQQFDKMADQDQAEFVGLLVQGAEKVLIAQGKTNLAAQVDQLFTKIPSGDQMPLGMTEFEINLALARVADVKRVENDPNAPRLEVEHAMIVTLKKNGIVLPPSFMTVAKDFKPRFPPAKEKKEKKN